MLRCKPGWQWLILACPVLAAGLAEPSYAQFSAQPLDAMTNAQPAAEAPAAAIPAGTDGAVPAAPAPSDPAAVVPAPTEAAAAPATEPPPAAAEALPSTAPDLPMPEGAGAEPVPSSLPTNREPAAPNPDVSFHSASRWNLSLMFNTADRSTIQKILDFLAQRQQSGSSSAPDPASEDERFNQLLDDIIDRVNPNAAATQSANPTIPAKPKIAEIPAFFLQSILYKSPQEWAIWLNGKKYTPWEKPTTFTIVNVNQRYAVLQWKTEALDEIAPNWNKRKNRNRYVTVDPKEGKVTFRLYPNQSFASRILDVVEGKVVTNPVVSPDADGKAANGAAVQDAPPPPVGPDVSTLPPPQTPGIFNSIFDKDAQGGDAATAADKVENVQNRERRAAERMQGIYDNFRRGGTAP